MRGTVPLKLHVGDAVASDRLWTAVTLHLRYREEFGSSLLFSFGVPARILSYTKEHNMQETPLEMNKCVNLHMYIHLVAFKVIIVTRMSAQNLLA